MLTNSRRSLNDCTLFTVESGLRVCIHLIRFGSGSSTFKDCWIGIRNLRFGFYLLFSKENFFYLSVLVNKLTLYFCCHFKLRIPYMLTLVSPRADIVFINSQLHQRSGALSARPPPEERKSGSCFSFPFPFMFNDHISEYALVIFLIQNHLPIKHQWHLTVDLRFNGSIN